MNLINSLKEIALLASDLNTGLKSNALKSFCEILSEIQCLAIIFYLQTQYVFSSKLNNILIDYISSLSQLLVSPELTENAAENLYILGYGWGLLLFISVVAKLLLLKWKVNEEKLEVFSIIIKLNESLFYFISVNVIISCLIDDVGSSGLLVLMLCLIYCFTLLTTYFSHETPNPSARFSSREASFRTSIIFIKGLIAPLLMLSQKFIPTLFAMIACCIFFAWKLFGIFLSYPWRDSFGDIIAFSLSSLQALLTIITFLFTFLTSNPFYQEALLYLNFFLLPFIVKAASMYRRHHLISLFCKEDSKISSINEVFGKLIAIDFIQASTSLSYDKNFTSLKDPFLMYILGKSLNEDQEIKWTNGMLNSDVLLEDLFKNYIFRTLEAAFVKFPGSIEIKIYYAYYLNQYSKRFFRAIKLLDSMKKSSMEVVHIKSYHFLLKHTEKTIHKTIMFENGLDVRTLIKFDKISSNLLQKIQDNAQLYVEYWESFKRQDLVFSQLYAKGLNLESKAREINIIWNDICLNLPEYVSRFYVLYYSYLCLIRSAPHSAEMLKNLLKNPIDDTFKAFQNIDNSNIYDESNLLFRVSLSPKTMGHILDCPRNIERLLGWNQKDLMNKTIENIMPSFIAQQHRSIWKNFGESETIRSIMHAVSYCKQKNGFYVPSDVYSAIYPYITGDLLAISIIRPLSEYKPFILVREDGIIDAISESVNGVFYVPKPDNLHIVDLFIANSTAISDQFSRVGAFSKFEQKNYNNQTALDVFNKIKEMGDEIDLISFLNNECTAIIIKATRMQIFNLFCYCIEIHHFTSFTFDKLEESSLDSLQIASEKISDIEAKVVCKTLELDGNNIFNTLTHTKFTDVPTDSHNGAQVEIQTEENSKVKSLAKKPDTRSINTVNLVDDQPQTDADIIRDIASVSDGSSTRSTRSASRSTEAMLYSTPIENQFKILYYFGVSFVVISCVLLLVLMIKTDTRIKQTLGNIELVEDTTILQREITRVSRMILSYYLIGNGIWTDNRYDKIGIPNLRNFRQKEIFDRGILLNEKKNKIQTSIKNLEAEFQQKVVDLSMTIKDEGELIIDRKIHPFQTITQLFESIINIAQIPPNLVDQNDRYIRFFINNAFDDLLLEIEDIQEVVISNTNLQLNDNMTLSTNFAIGMAIASVIILSYFIATLKDFLRDRSILIYNLLSIDEDKIDIHMTEVFKFITFLSEHRESKSMKKTMLSKKKGPDSKKRKKKYANMAGLNMHLYALVGYSMLWICFFFMPLIILQLIASTSNDKIIGNIKNEAHLNTIMYDMDLMLSAYYLNVTDGPTRTEKHVPVNEIVEQLYDSFSRSNDFFVSIQFEGISNLVTECISGDLCNLNLQTQFTHDVCNSIGKGALKFGILGVNSLVGRAVKNSLEYYKRSSQSQSEKILAFSDIYMIDSEIAMDYIVYPAYLALQNEIHSSIGDQILLLKSTMISFIIPCLVLQFIFGVFSWKRLYLKFKTEKLGWRKICRHIPFAVVRTNKLMMGYLSKHSDTKLVNLANNS